MLCISYSAATPTFSKRVLKNKEEDGQRGLQKAYELKYNQNI